MLFSAFSCASKGAAMEDQREDEAPSEFIQKKAPGGNYGVYYQIFVGSFCDGNGDGTGDLRGIIQKLDYINDGNLASNRSLHADGIWLTPIHPSRTYHKYDVMDYMAIDRSFGTMGDFEELIAECNKRGIKVIIDLVLNHTSIEHPWFQAARRGDKKHLDYYNIADSKLSNKYYPLGYGGKFYEGDFWSEMPDLNLDNPDVRKEIQAIADFWIAKGAAGFRLDAVLFYYHEQQKSIDFLTWFTSFCKSRKNDIYMVGEVWDNAGTILNFYDSKIPSLFNFTFAQEKGLLPTAVTTQNGVNVSTAMINWNSIIKEKNVNAIDAVFLSNHDNNRSAGYFNQDLVKMKMAAALYLTMPGNPFVYYGEEIGTTGSGRDENKRAPMLWSVKNRAGICKAPFGTDQRMSLAAGVEEQLRNSSSLARFYIEAIRLRNLYPVLFYGTPQELKTADRSVAAWTLTGRDAKMAVVHNLSAAEKKLDIAGAKALGGSLNAQNSAAAPVLSGTTLSLPPFSTALVELSAR
jgi:alpha-amylase